MSPLRAGLPELPESIRDLPVDDRGYPVPRFVAWIDGKPDFRVMDGQYFDHCRRFETCWICGRTLGAFRAFVIGPMCAVNRVSAEPPSHRNCGEFAAKACPFLTMPKMVRREAGMPEQAVQPAGHMIRRNPGVALVWVTRSEKAFSAPGGWLFDIGDPIDTMWFCQGRTATRAEVLESITSGLPLLQEAAPSADDRAMLDAAVERAMEFVPAEATP